MRGNWIACLYDKRGPGLSTIAEVEATERLLRDPIAHA